MKKLDDQAKRIEELEQKCKTLAAMVIEKNNENSDEIMNSIKASDEIERATAKIKELEHALEMIIKADGVCMGVDPIHGEDWVDGRFATFARKALRGEK